VEASEFDCSPFFELPEILSWMRALPRIEAHVLDAGHKLLETHAAAAQHCDHGK
jgi:hypothetical protein